jgi:hypothetical protein
VRAPRVVSDIVFIAAAATGGLGLVVTPDS